MAPVALYGNISRNLLVSGALLGLASISIGIRLVLSKPEKKLPRVGIDPGPFGLRVWPAAINFAINGNRLVEDGYRKFTDSCFRLQTLFVDVVVVPPRFLAELSMLPETKLNSSQALVDRTLGIYNGVDIILKDHQSSNICRVQLTKNLPTLLPFMENELRYAWGIRLKDCTDENFTAFNAFDLIFDTVLRVTSRVFVGDVICRDQRWYNEIAAYQTDVALIVVALLPFPNCIRPFVAPFVPFRWHLNRIHNSVRALIFPDRGTTEGPVREGDLNLVKFFIQNSKDGCQDTVVAQILVLLSAAIHGTTNALVHLLFDLCAMPEWIPKLREEAGTALKSSYGIWQHDPLKELRLLDSFFKESQRFNTPSFLNFTRKVMSPIKLSDGVTELLPGMTITMATAAITRDPTYYENPEQFVGDRFMVKRGEHSGKMPTEFDFTSTGHGNISWGKGRFTCPGRWYANDEMKLIIATMLLEYDIKFPNGQTTRPKGYFRDDTLMPNPKQEILLRRREGIL